MKKILLPCLGLTLSLLALPTQKAFADEYVYAPNVYADNCGCNRDSKSLLYPFDGSAKVNRKYVQCNPIKLTSTSLGSAKLEFRRNCHNIKAMPASNCYCVLDTRDKFDNPGGDIYRTPTGRSCRVESVILGKKGCDNGPLGYDKDCIDFSFGDENITCN